MHFGSRRQRRKEVLAAGFRPEWRQLVDRRMPQWRHLDDDERDRVEWWSLQLLAERRWEAAQGFELTTEMEVTIAANAALLVLELPDDAYDEVHTVIVHPSTVVLHGERYLGGGVVTDAPLPIEGEANEHAGPVLISWDAALGEVRHPGRGRNVIHHEFAHKLDMLTGMVDGTPPLGDTVPVQDWVRVCTAAYDAVLAGHSVLDPYAGTNPGEFFAVATETFFAAPRALLHAEPDLYDVLAAFYAQDPVARQGASPVRLGHRNDPSVQAELDWARHGVDLPAGLELQWLGTAGFRLAYEGTTLLIDPYLTRRSLAATLGARPHLGDPALIERHLPAADAVLVGHTHFDHAVDVPAIAELHGCEVYGSTSLAHLMGLFSLAERAVVVEPHRRYDIGPFAVSFTPSRHSKLMLGLAVPMAGELTCDSLDHLRSGAYRCGQVWGITIEVAGTTIYHQGSADLIEDEVRTHDVDLFCCGIAGRGFTPHFTERALRTLNPRVVLAHHHDDFFRPVTDDMGFSFNVNLGGFVEDVDALAPDVAVRTLAPLQTVAGA